MADETERVRLDLTTLRQGIRALLESRVPGRYWVAELDSRIVGQLLVTYEWSDWRNGWFWWIQSVFIKPEARGQKLYSRMYDFVKERAREAGNVCGFRLYVENDNYHAQKVYDAVGMHASHYLMYEEETTPHGQFDRE